MQKKTTSLNTMYKLSRSEFEIIERKLEASNIEH